MKRYVSDHVTPSEETVDVYAGSSSQRYVTDDENAGVSQHIYGVLPAAKFLEGLYFKAIAPDKIRYGYYNTVEYPWQDREGTGVWQNVERVITADDNSDGPFYFSAALAGDYLVDNAYMYRQSLLVYASAWPNCRIRATVTTPASGVCPLHLVFRADDDGLNYSMVRLHPATDGNDTHIIERVAGPRRRGPAPTWTWRLTRNMRCEWMYVVATWLYM